MEHVSKVVFQTKEVAAEVVGTIKDVGAIEDQ